jgi:uncharacterized membrane protein/glutaredoxin
MTRRRSSPWIHRWSRPIIGVLALIGAIGTGYLTVVKFTGGTAACTGACGQVLSSPYGTVFGLPLTLFGFLGYLTMGILATAPLLINADSQKKARMQWEAKTWPLLFMGATAMAVFSGYLMYILATKLQVPCEYCIGSALISLSFFVLTLIGQEWEDIGQVFFTGIAVSLVVLVGAFGVYANVDRKLPDVTASGSAAPPITTTSGPAEIALAQHLSQVGAKEYGAYWCPHCHDQKQLFGKEAAALLTYIECDPKGQNARPDLCQAAGVTGFPTWEIKGETLPGGIIELEKLASLSGYAGPRNFQNSIPKP